VASRLQTGVQPNAHGFDYFFGFKSGYIDYYQHTDGDGESDLFENQAPVHADGYMTDLITERSIKFIDDHAAAPFFLEVTYNAAHWPFQVPDHPSVAAGHARFVQPEENDTATRKDYVAILERADQGIGRILQTLKQRGLDRNTLVVYMQDNGGEWILAQRAAVQPEGNGVGRRHSRPCHLPLARAPSRRQSVRPRSASFRMSRRRYWQRPARPYQQQHGRKASTCCQCSKGATWRSSARCSSASGTALPSRFAVRQGSWKLLVDGAKRYVFDLSKDVGERNDLTNLRQDIAQRLRPLIAAWEADVDAEAKVNSSAATK
jgi:arylsulfatase A-like enzyme